MRIVATPFFENTLTSAVIEHYRIIMTGQQAHVLSHLLTEALEKRPELSVSEHELLSFARYLQDINRGRRLK